MSKFKPNYDVFNSYYQNRVSIDAKRILLTNFNNCGSISITILY